MRNSARNTRSFRVPTVPTFKINTSAALILLMMVMLQGHNAQVLSREKTLALGGGAPFAHAVMHSTAVLHSYHTDLFLPPHR